MNLDEFILDETRVDLYKEIGPEARKRSNWYWDNTGLTLQGSNSATGGNGRRILEQVFTEGVLFGIELQKRISRQS